MSTTYLLSIKVYNTNLQKYMSLFCLLNTSACIEMCFKVRVLLPNIFFMPPQIRRLAAFAIMGFLFLFPFRFCFTILLLIGWRFFKNRFRFNFPQFRIWQEPPRFRKAAPDREVFVYGKGGNFKSKRGWGGGREGGPFEAAGHMTGATAAGLAQTDRPSFRRLAVRWRRLPITVRLMRAESTRRLHCLAFSFRLFIPFRNRTQTSAAAPNFANHCYSLFWSLLMFDHFFGQRFSVKLIHLSFKKLFQTVHKAPVAKWLTGKINNATQFRFVAFPLVLGTIANFMKSCINVSSRSSSRFIILIVVLTVLFKLSNEVVLT